MNKYKFEGTVRGKSICFDDVAIKIRVGSNILTTECTYIIYEQWGESYEFAAVAALGNSINPYDDFCILTKGDKTWKFSGLTMLDLELGTCEHHVKPHHKTTTTMVWGFVKCMLT